MAPAHQVSHRQLELLVEFIEANRDIALNRKVGGPLGNQRAIKAWEDCARMLNGVGDGLSKPGSQWKRYWHMLKSRVKGKVAEARRARSGTGGGPSKFSPLTDLEERVAAVIGSVAVEGLPVRIAVDLNEESRQPLQEININAYGQHNMYHLPNVNFLPYEMEIEVQDTPLVSVTAVTPPPTVAPLATVALRAPPPRVAAAPQLPPPRVAAAPQLPPPRVAAAPQLPPPRVAAAPQLPPPRVAAAPQLPPPRVAAAPQLPPPRVVAAPQLPPPRVAVALQAPPPRVAASRVRQARANCDDAPHWARNLEERRMEIEGQLANAVTGIAHMLQQLGAVQERMVDAMQLNNSLLQQLVQLLPPP